MRMSDNADGVSASQASATEETLTEALARRLREEPDLFGFGVYSDTFFSDIDTLWTEYGDLVWTDLPTDVSQTALIRQGDSEGIDAVRVILPLLSGVSLATRAMTRRDLCTYNQQGVAAASEALATIADEIRLALRRYRAASIDTTANRKEQPVFTTPPMSITMTPDNLPAVVYANVDAALVLLDGALTALDRSGYAMEHHKSAYGAVYRATQAVIERAYPGLDGEAVLVDRHYYGLGGKEILTALAVAKRKAGL